MQDHPARILCALLCAGLLVAPAAGGWDRAAGPVAGTPQAIGGYARGCLIGAEALSGEGDGYQVLRLSRERHYGHPELISFVEDLGRRVAQARLGMLLIGDLAQPRGGPMPWGHSSHQTGLDVDIFLRLDQPRLAPDEREALEPTSKVDTDRQQVNRRFGPEQAELIRIAASDPRVARIFVNAPIKKALCEAEWSERGFLRRVRPWHGHTRHMHVRLHCPEGNRDCEAQRPPPPGDGCGEELASWFEAPEPPAEADTPPRRRRPELPRRCAALR